MQIAHTLYHDKTTSIADVCRTLRISRAILYRYITAGSGSRPDTGLRLFRTKFKHGIRSQSMENAVDMDDIDEVLDLYFHRLVQLHVEEGLPLSVLPVQTAGATRPAARRSTPPGHSVST